MLHYGSLFELIAGSYSLSENTYKMHAKDKNTWDRLIKYLHRYNSMHLHFRSMWYDAGIYYRWLLLLVTLLS